MDPPKRVVVCGGGVIGVCTAYFLSKKGAAVTLVEKSSIACAASGKAGGFLALDWCDGGPVSSLARASFKLHRTLAEELNGSELYGYRPVTTLSVTVTETASYSVTRKTPGPNLPAWVDGPAKGPRTIGTTETTAQVHPQLFTKTLVEKAVAEYGLKVVIGKLEKVEVAGGTATAVVLEDGGVIEADAVVLALGPWTGKLSLLGSIFRISGLKAHSIVMEPKDPSAITPHALFLSYYAAEGGKPMDPEVYPRPTVDPQAKGKGKIRLSKKALVFKPYKHHRYGKGRRNVRTPLELGFEEEGGKGEVYICGMSADADVPDDPEQIMPVPESIRVLKNVARSVSSHLVEGEATVKAEQACFLPCTDDSVPVIGQVPGVNRCYVATGHSCWGILNGPATGAAVSELVLDGRASLVDLARFDPARFLRTTMR